jgi:hypothetical protein
LLSLFSELDEAPPFAFEALLFSPRLAAPCEARLLLEPSDARSEACEDAPLWCFISLASLRSGEFSEREARLDEVSEEEPGELSRARSVACSRELRDCASGFCPDSRFCELVAGEALGLAELSARDCSRCERW